MITIGVAKEILVVEAEVIPILEVVVAEVEEVVEVQVVEIQEEVEQLAEGDKNKDI